jgi:hypothetical protein
VTQRSIAEYAEEVRGPLFPAYKEGQDTDIQRICRYDQKAREGEHKDAQSERFISWEEKEWASKIVSTSDDGSIEVGVGSYRPLVFEVSPYLSAELVGIPKMNCELAASMAYQNR